MHSISDELINMSDELHQGFSARHIKRRVASLVGVGYLPAAEQPEWEQDLKLHLWRKSPQFDPSRGTWSAFATTVTDHQVATLLDYRLSAQRHPQRLLRQSTTGDENVVHQLDATVHARRTGCQGRSPQESFELQHDVSAVLKRLPQDDRRLCLLLKYHTPSEVARQLGVPRSTLQSWIRRLRVNFEEQGLRRFLSNPS